MTDKLPPDMFRSDGSEKSAKGYLGPVINARDGKTMTEFTIGVQIDGEEINIPSMVPTLSSKEVEILQNSLPGEKIPESIQRKAKTHALMRMEQGKNIFYQDGEELEEMPEDYREGGRVRLI
jgi:hypothetical protein|tara:strand:- start:235 stop:600 length:366 start_codon:yes stop_codon:yes gene_type:complete